MSKTLALALAMIVTFATSGVQAAGLKIGVIGYPRADTELGLYGGDFGTGVEEYVAANIPGAKFVPTQTVTSSFLSTVDIVILTAASTFGDSTTPLSASEQTALKNFVLAGHGAFIVGDGYYSPPVPDSFVGPFGAQVGLFSILDETAVAVNVPNPLTNGPFGESSSLTFPTGVIGVSSDFAKLPAGALPALTFGGGNYPLAYLPTGSLGPNSGRVVLLADGEVGLASLIRQDGLFLNAVAYVAMIPEPSSWALLVIGVGALLPGRYWLSRRHPDDLV